MKLQEFKTLQVGDLVVIPKSNGNVKYIDAGLVCKITAIREDQIFAKPINKKKFRSPKYIGHVERRANYRFWKLAPKTKGATTKKTAAKK